MPKTKIETRNYAWGLGGVADNLLTFGLAWTIIPIFNIGYGVDAFWLGVAIFLPRLLDVVTDPIMGVISDRTRSRFGRRRPYILIGAVAMAALFAVLWMPPFGAVATAETAAPAASGASSGWSIPPLPTGDELGLLIWIGVVYSLVTLAYTVFSVPYIALGYEFTRNYDAMTKVMASRLYFTTIASFAVPWIYRLSVDDRFGGDETVGMRSVGVLIAVFVLVTGIVPALLCKEEKRVERPKLGVGIGGVVKATLGNRAFVLVMAAMLIFVIALYSTGALLTHINVFHVAGGDKQLGAKYSAIYGNITAVCTLIGMYPMMVLSRKTSKKVAAVLAFALIIAGSASLWFTWSPEHPTYQYASAAVVGFGSSGIWLMLDSMIGDVAKDDEARNGVQREGVYGASKSFMFKLAVAATSILGALVLSGSGFEEGIAPGEDVRLNLRVLYIVIQAGGAALAIAAILFFPISRTRAESNEAVIEERMAAQNGTCAPGDASQTEG